LFADRTKLADYGEPMAYDDGTVACTDEALIIHRYYFPPRAKRIPYGKIRQVPVLDHEAVIREPRHDVHIMGARAGSERAAYCGTSTWFHRDD
jgi:hypothetical protein